MITFIYRIEKNVKSKENRLTIKASKKYIYIILNI